MSSYQKSKPNIVARLQAHSTGFSICVNNNDLAGAMLMIQLLNQDLPKHDRLIVGHGIDKSTIDETDKELKRVRLLDENCQSCKTSTLQADIHPPPEIVSGQDKLHAGGDAMQWISKFAIMVEGRVSDVGYERKWWHE